MDKIFVERLSHLLYICNFLERSKTGLYESSEQQGSQCGGWRNHELEGSHSSLLLACCLSFIHLFIHLVLIHHSQS